MADAGGYRSRRVIRHPAAAGQRRETRLASATVAADEVRRRPASAAAAARSTGGGDAEVLFAYPAIKRKSAVVPGEATKRFPVAGQLATGNADDHQHHQHQHQHQHGGNTAPGDRGTDAPPTAAFPANSKLSALFFTPEYLAGVERDLVI